MYDCIIIGMGCAGMSAGIYAKRAGMKVIMLDENMPGASLNNVSLVENYLGFKSITGSELAFQMFEHVQNEEIEFDIAKVVGIEVEDDCKIVHTDKGDFKAKGIIISAGRKYKRSGIANENKFIGKGVSYCAVCDAPLYKGKDIVVLGSGDSAFEQALYLNRFAKKVTLVTNGRIKAAESNVCKVQKEKIEIVDNKKVVEFLGEDYITGVKLDDGRTIKCAGVFIFYGSVGGSDFLSPLGITDEKGYIIVDVNMKTAIDGIYACGDIIKKEVYQIATAVGEGAIAATCLKKELDKK